MTNDSIEKLKEVLEMKITLAIYTLLLLTPMAVANENTFTLEEIVERVVKVSPSLEVHNRDLDISESKVKKARAQQYPQFEGAVLTGGIFNVIRADLFQPIYTFGKISADEKKAKKGVEVTIANISEARDETIARAKNAYFNLQLAHTLNDLATEERDNAKKLLSNVEELVSVGSPKATQIDKLNLKILVSNIDKHVVSSQKAIDIVRAELMRMLAIEENSDFDIESYALEPVEFEANELSYYKDKAIEDRPKIKAINAGLEAKLSSIKREKSEYYPTIFVGGTIRYSQSPLFRDTFIGGAGIGIRQVLNFFISADLSEAKAEYSKSIKEKDAFLQEIDLEVKKAYLDMQENKDNVNNEREGFRAARTLLRNASSNYDLGIGKVNELTNSIGTYLREGAEYYDTVFLYNIAVTNLEKVAGVLNKELE